MNYTTIENQTIEIKGKEHPDCLADRFAEVAIEAINEFNPDLYANVDKSYLKGGKFPVFNVQGYMSFDFRDYDKEYRYELFDFIKQDIVSEFKSIFPTPVIDVDFDLNFEPSMKDELVDDNLFTDTAYLVAINGYTELENDMMLLGSYIDDIEFVGRDYKLLLVDGDKLIINQTFNNPDIEYFDDYVEMVSDYVYTSLPSLKEVDLRFNTDYDETGVFYSRFGSSLFYNSSGSVGKGNQWYGFTSPERRWCETPYGKHPNHPAKRLLNVAKYDLEYTDDNTEYILFANIGDSLDNYDIIKHNIN